MTAEFKDQRASLRAMARENYDELVEFASQQMSQLKDKDTVGARTAAINLVAEITSEVAAETAAETAAEAAAQIAGQAQSRGA
jgi:hypothetical protein